MSFKRNPSSLSRAWRTSPGPDNARQALWLAAKGFCMGSADIIPGVSGGTVAFITGIYSQLLAAIKSFDINFASRLVRLDIAGALAGVHARFLFFLLCGLLAALVSMARVMHWFLINHPVEIWSLFFGLIAASVLVMGRGIGSRGPLEWGALALGAVMGFVLVGLIPVDTPETLWFLFISGMIAICAMILPGISGAFILLILGKYEFVTATLKNPFLPGNMLVIVVFAAGCVVGVLGFSRLAHWFLTRWPGPAMALLTGLVAGAMRKVWPFKEVLETKVVRGKVLVLRDANVLPDSFGPDVVLAVGLMLAGLVMVLLVDGLSRRGRK